MFLGICDEILINSNPIGVSPTALIAPDFSSFGTISSSGENAYILAPGPKMNKIRTLK